MGQAKEVSLSEKCFNFGVMYAESVVNFTFKGVVASGCSYCLPAVDAAGCRNKVGLHDGQAAGKLLPLESNILFILFIFSSAARVAGSGFIRLSPS